MKLILSVILMFGGLFFFIVGSIGLIRFPDLYSRTHSATKCDTLGAMLCILALMVNTTSGWSILKMVIVILFLWLSNPTAAHLIGLSAMNANLPHSENTVEIDYTEVEKK